jgi:hypothetical protein
MLLPTFGDEIAAENNGNGEKFKIIEIISERPVIVNRIGHVWFYGD